MEMATIPMPGEHLGADIVIASCFTNDDGSHVLLLLKPESPHYEVADYDRNGRRLGGVREYATMGNIAQAALVYDQWNGNGFLSDYDQKG